MGLTVGGDHSPRAPSRQKERWVARPAHDGEDRRVGHHRARLRAPTPSARCSRRPAATATSTCSTARRRSSPTAPTPTPSCSSASSTRATRPAERKILSFVLDSRHARPRAVEAAAQDGHALVAHRRAVPHRRAGRPSTACIGETEDVPAGGREGAKDTFSDGALRRGRHGARHHRAVPRAVRRLRQEPRAVRPAHRRVPAHPGQAGPHGGRPPQRAEPRVPHHRDERRRARA